MPAHAAVYMASCLSDMHMISRMPASAARMDLRLLSRFLTLNTLRLKLMVRVMVIGDR